MKRLALLMVLILPPLWGQSDVTRADVYQAGDVLDYFGVDATNAEPGPAGVGVTWDFSNLPRLPEEDYQVVYDVPAAAPNAGQFPEANLVAIQDAGDITAYTFMKATNDQFVLEGLDLPELGVVTYSDKSLWLNFPLSYNETQTDDFVGTYVFNFQGISGIADRTGTLTTTYDGYGTIILPDGTSVSNVRRLKLEQTVTDVIMVSGVSITTVVDTTNYLYFAEGDRTELFELVIAETTVTPPGMTTESKLAYYHTANGGGGQQPTYGRRGAHLTTQGGDFQSEILVYNPTNSQKQIELTPFEEDGSALDTVTLNLAAGSTTRELQDGLFPASAKSFASDGCEECIFSVGYRANTDDASTAQVHQSTRFENEFYFYPGEWDLLFDGAAIINAGSEAAQVEAKQYDDNGNLLATVELESALAAGGKHLTIFNTLFENRPDSVVKLESTQPMSVMILRISNDGRFLYQNLPLPAEPSQNDSRWLAHITSETGGFDTDIYVHNTSGSAKAITFHPFTQGGQDQDDVPLAVPANATLRFAKTDLFSGDTSHAAITGDTSVLVTVGYRSRVENSSTAAIHEAPPVGNQFTLYPGEWDVLFDGFALVNTGANNATITVNQIGDDGNVRNTEVLVEDLAPNGKFLGLLEGLIPNDPNSVIQVTSTEPLAILVLRLSKDSRYLYGNNPLP